MFFIQPVVCTLIGFEKEFSACNTIEVYFFYSKQTRSTFFASSSCRMVLLQRGVFFFQNCLLIESKPAEHERILKFWHIIEFSHNHINSRVKVNEMLFNLIEDSFDLIDLRRAMIHFLFRKFTTWQFSIHTSHLSSSAGSRVCQF